MANEVVAGPKDVKDNGFVHRQITLYFDLTQLPDGTADDVRVKDNDGNVIATQSSSRIPAWSQDKWTQSMLDAVDAGDAAFHRQTFVQSPGESNVELLGRIRDAYLLLRSWWAEERRTRFEDQGVTQDA